MSTPIAYSRTEISTAVDLARHFIAKFEAIPADEWTDEGVYQNDSGQCCALGHCGESKWGSGGARLDASATSPHDGPRLRWLFEFHCATNPDKRYVINVPDVNDGICSVYGRRRLFDPRYDDFATPKARILTALRDILANAERQLAAVAKTPSS